MKYNNCLFFLSLWCKWESHLVLEQSSSPYCVLCFYYWSLLRTFVSGTWHSFISCSGIISSYFPSRSLLLHTAVLKTVGDPIFVHYFISWKSYQRFWERTAVRWNQKAVWTVGLLVPKHERLGVWARSRERAETWWCIMGSFVFFLNGDVSLESSGHSERVQRAVGASNVRMFLAFKGLVHLEDWAFFFLPSCLKAVTVWNRFVY